MLEMKGRIAKIIEDAFVALRFGQDPLENEKHLAVEAADRISAYLEAVGGEPVGHRWRGPDGKWVCSWDRPLMEPTEYAQALYTAPQAPAVRVKGLEWEPNSKTVENSLWVNVEEINRYYTIDPESNVFRLQTQLMLSEYGSDDLGLFPTVEAAKAAGQADHDRRIASRIRSALEAETGGGEPVTLVYTNYRGETAARAITPKRIWFGATEWHPEPQWLLTAFDHGKHADRDFALKDFGTQPATTPDAREVEALIWLREQMICEQEIGVSGFEDWISKIDAALAQGESRNG